MNVTKNKLHNACDFSKDDTKVLQSYSDLKNVKNKVESLFF